EPLDWRGSSFSPETATSPASTLTLASAASEQAASEEIVLVRPRTVRILIRQHQCDDGERDREDPCRVRHADRDLEPRLPSTREDRLQSVLREIGDGQAEQRAASPGGDERPAGG